jgi:predicted nuclease with TOPRIM domain
MMEYPNIVVKSHKGIGYITYDEYTREEIEIIDSNIAVLSNNDINRYLSKLLRQYNTNLNELTNSDEKNEKEKNSESIQARISYLKTAIAYLNQRLDPFINEIDEIKKEITGLSHIVTICDDNEKYRINANIKLIDIIRLIYCLNKDNKLGRVLLTKDMIRLITGKFIWKEEIKSKTVKSYFNQMNNEVKLERMKLSKDIRTMDEAGFINLINGLI